MARIYRRWKIILIILAIIYLSLCIYQSIYTIKLDNERLRFLKKISNDPLCTAHSEVVRRLRVLTKDLISLRMEISDNNPQMISKINNHYDNLQHLLQEIELLTNTEHATVELTKTEKGQDLNPREINMVCPEIYLGTTFGYPFYYNGFETSNCSRNTPVKNLVTLIFDEVPVAKISDQGEVAVVEQFSYVNQLENFINKVNDYYPDIRAYIVSNKTENTLRSLERNFNKTKIKFIRTGSVPRGHVLQKIIDKIKTPYVLIAKELTHFTRHVNLERLIRVLSSHNSTLFAGGSAKNRTGHWENNCYRLQLRNYTLSYKSGYYRSYNDCLVCDHLAGPFLAKTSFLKTFKLYSSLNHGVYEDLFLRLKYQHGNHGNAQVVSCPDVMFHIQKADVSDEELLPFATRHSIRKITEANGRVRWYGCKRDIKHRAGDRCSMRHGLAVAPCCLENLADAVKFIMSECEYSNVVCELQEGTLLGAVKFNKVLPWERDADITFLTSDYDKLMSMRRVMEERGYLFREITSPRCCEEGRMAGGQAEILADGWSIQMYGQHKMDSERLINQGVRPTQLLFCGQWVNVPENPGKYIRNRYGLDIYRHAEHWITAGAESGWVKYDTNGFVTCPVRGFHGCLDNYAPDGSVQFENLF